MLRCNIHAQQPCYMALTARCQWKPIDRMHVYIYIYIYIYNILYIYIFLHIYISTTLRITVLNATYARGGARDLIMEYVSWSMNCLCASTYPPKLALEYSHMLRSTAGSEVMGIIQALTPLVDHSLLTTTLISSRLQVLRLCRGTVLS